MVQENLEQIYSLLFSHFGFQNWWPGETKDEIIIGAILTQSVSWQNVEKAIQNLKSENLCNLFAIHQAELGKIAKLIEPTFYFNQKALKLKNFTEMFYEKFRGNFDKLFALDLIDMRSEFLDLNGIGPETADSIILYAAEKPIFVVDAYTKRIFSRLGYVIEKWKYQEIQDFFMKNLPHKVGLFKDLHAQIVKLGKEYCRKRNPVCDVCPLGKMCKY
ncbi:MAG: endonuclease III domain-containing protein [Candidatus Cloacimonetes bacterium]|nr:endonuclease III domain-containing protein [Candidatus Cloacimonadota bacterium]MCF7815006.1 endonuclease III domain-containing protein [Candidatus Cloacimonadota bacterium]MCF7869249.1 endonuclease III domain-containing protein [Candidatus Cloacimonadota bacterium]MCF7884683.1 endonuclease III domain-containing protein [Candidatus Cloacimonadota bacterium]